MLSLWRNGTPAHRRYVLRTWAFMVPYFAICAAMILGAFDEIEGQPAAWVLAAALSAPVIGQLWATLSLMRESDEFVRALTARQFIIATGLTLATAVFWGFGETLAGAPHIDAWLIYPLFWFFWGVTAPFIQSTRT